MEFLLDEEALPESWYNIVPDLPFGLEPPLKPATREPVGSEAFSEIFPEEIIHQEVTTEPYNMARVSYGQKPYRRITILFNLCGHFDLDAYEQYLAGELVDLEYSEEEIERAVARIPG